MRTAPTLATLDSLERVEQPADSSSGALTGTAIDNEDTLAFSVQEHIRPMIETRRLDHAAEAYARMMRGDARFRIVLVTGQ